MKLHWALKYSFSYLLIVAREDVTCYSREQSPYSEARVGAYKPPMESEGYGDCGLPVE